jgi:hypothetical protein
VAEIPRVLDLNVQQGSFCLFVPYFGIMIDGIHGSDGADPRSDAGTWGDRHRPDRYLSNEQVVGIYFLTPGKAFPHSVNYLYQTNV